MFSKVENKLLKKQMENLKETNRDLYEKNKILTKILADERAAHKKTETSLKVMKEDFDSSRQRFDEITKELKVIQKKYKQEKADFIKLKAKYCEAMNSLLKEID